MSEIKGRHQLGKPNLYSIANSLEKLQKDVARIVGGNTRIKTDVYSSEIRKEEREEQERWYEEQRQKNKSS